MLEIKDVSKVYRPEGQSSPLVAVDNVSLHVKAGEFVSIVGPSGCGKSTLLEIIGGLSAPSSGIIRLNDQELRGPHPAVGMVFQEDSTFPWRTVLENVEFGLETRGVARRERREKAQAMINLVGLVGYENLYPAELSGGMRQRVAIARTLVMSPELILMDEPFGALDEQTRLILGEELLRIWSETRATILFVTHSLDEASMLSDRVIVMSARPGRIKALVKVDLPRPRTSEIIASESFSRITGELWHGLREEALKVMAPGRNGPSKGGGT